MKFPIRTSLFFTTFLLVFVTALLVVARDYPPNVRMAPSVVGIPTWILLFILWLGEVNPGWRLLNKKRVEGSIQAGEEEAEFTSWGPVLNVLAWIFLFYVFIFFFGFILVTPVFLTAFLIRKGEVRWRFAVPSAIFSTLIFWGLIEGIFKIDLWLGLVPEVIPGVFGGSIMPPL
jgi:hypothetical protein